MRKFIIIIPLILWFSGLYSCRSPESPTPQYEYRYNVKVNYTRDLSMAKELRTNGEDRVSLFAYLYDPDASFDISSVSVVRMDKIGDNKFKSILPKVFTQLISTKINTS